MAGCMVPSRETLVFKFFDKGGEHSVPDENGEYRCLKEITVNMEDVYAAMEK